MRIGIDVDGVLASFFAPYERLHFEIEGVNKFPAMDPRLGPPDWNWPKFYGYAAETTDEAWRRIKASKDFWLTLQPMPDLDAFVAWYFGVSLRHDIYFVTARPGVGPQYQTQEWLREQGIGEANVIISDQKGLVCKAINMDLYIDDKAENIADVVAQSPTTHPFLLNRNYNHHLPQVDLYRMDTLMEILEWIK